MNETLDDVRHFATGLVEGHALPFQVARADDAKELPHGRLGDAITDLPHRDSACRMAFERLYQFPPAPLRPVVKREISRDLVSATRPRSSP